MKRKPDPWINYVICLILILGFMLSSFLTGEGSESVYSPPESPKITELRGVWLTHIESNIFFKPLNLNPIIRHLAQSHFNTLYPVAWSRGYPFYPSGVADEQLGHATYPGLGIFGLGSDALLAAVNEGHRQKIKVISWFEGGLIVPINSPLAQRYPEWLSQDSQGHKTLPLDILKDTFALKPAGNAIANWFHSRDQQKMQQWVWINPLYPEAQQFIKALILEVVRGYDVDGIQLDEHFSWPVNLGYDSFTVYLYQQEHSGKSPPNDPHDPEWMAWRAAKLTALVADISNSIKAIKPAMTISLTSQNATFAYQHYLQDWKTWVNQGLFNELTLQIYQNEITDFQTQLNDPDLPPILRQIPVSIGILAGTWDRPVEIKTLLQQIQMVRKQGFAGFSLFSWESLWGYITPDAPQRRRDVFNALLAEQALPPSFQRKRTRPLPTKTDLKEQSFSPN